MPDKEQLLEQLKTAVIAGDEEQARSLARNYVAAGFDPLEALIKGLGQAMNQLGQEYEAGTCFIPELLLASDAFYAGQDILKAALPTGGEGAKTGVVIGVIQGDTHDIGKNLVKIMLEAAGFMVYDLGRDVPPKVFIDKAEEVGARIIAVSALMTTAMDSIRQLVKDLRSRGLRDRYCVLIGGGPISKAFANQIGANDYGQNASEAVRLALAAKGN